MSGDSVTLPQGLSLTTPWHILAGTYGRYVSDPDSFDPDQSGVVFCAMPGMGFAVPTRALQGGDSASRATEVSVGRDNGVFVAGRCR